VESRNKEGQQQHVQVGVNEQSFHFIDVFLLKTYSNNNITQAFKCSVIRTQGS